MIALLHTYYTHANKCSAFISYNILVCLLQTIKSLPGFVFLTFSSGDFDHYFLGRLHLVHHALIINVFILILYKLEVKLLEFMN